ncbi:Dabb family protein [Pseudarthrobacter sp. BRE9]|uniref:Dabb family protein n=1 Tax=Pseudarthrobacter sp. BRE9 TaxID=2962582 RepID=UPI0028826A4D|nr:Dabb family protein [Pseudarthrobacter sp. BRE9]MDT0168385.1 Dabb family protein [Pseudarthrobacter sp. BRE9]
MIRHIVLFRVIEGTPAARVQEAIDRLEALVGVIPGLRSLKAGIDIGIEGNFDFGLVAELDDRAALEVFSDDPTHMEVAMFILEFRKNTDIAILDLEI